MTDTVDSVIFVFKYLHKYVGYQGTSDILQNTFIKYISILIHNGIVFTK